MILLLSLNRKSLLNSLTIISIVPKSLLDAPVLATLTSFPPMIHFPPKISSLLKAFFLLPLILLTLIFLIFHPSFLQFLPFSLTFLLQFLFYFRLSKHSDLNIRFYSASSPPSFHHALHCGQFLSTYLCLKWTSQIYVQVPRNGALKFKTPSLHLLESKKVVFFVLSSW